MRTYLTWLYLWVVLGLGWLRRASGAYTVSVLASPSTCYGGSPCLVQPSLAVYLDGVINLGFGGYVYANMEDSPSGLEPLYVGECDIDDNCGTRVSGSVAVAYFSNGVATFTDLMIKTAGEGYTLLFTLADANGNDLSFAYSSSFDVSVGPVFKQDFFQTVGAGTGGSPFSPNPTVALTDRGGNAITSINSGTVEASVFVGDVVLYPTDSRVVTIAAGYAVFNGLYINEAGGPYQLKFATSVADSAGTMIPHLYSSQFLVSVGSPAQLAFAPNASVELATITAGEFFLVAPRLYVQDAGGNTLVGDSVSGVEVRISDNPSDATLGLSTQLFEVAKKGVVTFSTLTIDKTGKEYRLAFVYNSFDADTNSFTTSTSIILYSERFDVEEGLPNTIQMATSADLAFAGGQPFGQQPSLRLLDRGSNVVGSDFQSVITAKIVSSLVTSAIIELDSGINDDTYVKNITTNLADSVEWWNDSGAGSVIIFTLHFNFEVWLAVGDALPTLELNVQNSGGDNVKAPLQQDSVMIATNSLVFNYTVGSGDAVPGSAPLDIASASTSLDLRGGTLQNGNGKNVITTTLPVGPVNQASVYHERIIINTATPYAVNITTPTTTGEYGVGELIEFYVLFDSPVVAEGTPWLELNAINTFSKMRARANYSHVDTESNNHTLVFSYLVKEGDTTTLNDIVNPHGVTHTLALRNESIYFDDSGGTTSSIKRLSDIPTTDASDSLSGFVAQLNALVNITIDTTVPTLDTTYGIIPATGNASETIYPGDSIPLYLRFTKPVVVMNDAVTLTLNCGAFSCYAQYVELLPDEKTFRFTLTVPQTAASSDLDIDSGGSALLSSSQVAYIKRKATTPTQNVDASTTTIYSTNSLAANADIVVAGAQATIVAGTHHNSYVSIYPSTDFPRVLFPDDTVTLEVQFSVPVVFSCSPVFLVQLEGITREAVYAQGNMTDHIYFNYTVNIGDFAPSLQYRYSPNALCLKTGCPTDVGSCTVLTYSEAPLQGASVAMPAVAISSITPQFGIVINDTFSINGTSLESSRPSTIVQITARYDADVSDDGTYDDPAGEYGAGNTIYFDVKFTDEVIWGTGSTTLPKLKLNIGQWALYSSGFESKTLTFSYTLTEADDTSSLLPEDISGTESPIYCDKSDPTDSCAIWNRNNNPANLGPGSIVDPSIVVETSAPRIEWAWTNKTTSPYDGFYTVGEEIVIKVRWSKKVSISGRNPRLVLDVTSAYLPDETRYATLDETLTRLEPGQSASGTTELNTMVFLYTVEAGDYSKNLTLAGTEIDRFFGLSYIYRAADTLITEVNYTLPYLHPLADNARGEYVSIDTSVIPRVESVEFITAAGEYMPGDMVVFVLTYSNAVILDGRATVKLRLGSGSLDTAVYIGYDPGYLNMDTTAAVSDASLLPSNATKELYFAYVLQEGQYNRAIDFVDAYSFDLGQNDLGAEGTLLAASTTPTLEADLDLPVPGETGSLSRTYSNQYVSVDGTVPYNNELGFSAAAGTYYAGDTIDIYMVFTAPVAVTGVPSIKLSPAFGSSQREAFYVGGSGSDTLTFRYIVQPGDRSAALDYYVDRSSLNSAVDSFLYNGATIKLDSDTPTVDAEVYLNPPSGKLGGSREATVTAGLASYLDLAIKKRGNDYKIIYECSPVGTNRTIYTSEVVFVSFSNEFELTANEGLTGDLQGSSVALVGNYAGVGAPGSNVSVTTIQTITTQASDPHLVPTKCIQLVGTEVTRRPAIQSFHTTGDVGTIVSGEFIISHSRRAGGVDSAPTRPIPVNVDSTQLAAIIESDLPHLGEIEISREPYIYCACENAFTWVITFTELTEGYVDSLLFDTTGMNSSTNSDIVGPMRLQEAGILSGYFTLGNPLNGLFSAAIQHNATDNDINRALAEIDLHAEHVNIIRPSNTNPREQLTWQITFEEFQHSYDIPLLSSTYTDTLEGNEALVWHQMVRPGVHGPGGLNGNFTATFRENTTVPLEYNASAADVKAALEGLDTINYVNVERSEASSINGYTWTVELVSINYASARGYYEDTIANVEPLMSTSYIIGTGAEVVVGTHYAMETFDPNDGARAGTFGRKSGAAYLYERDGDEWVQLQLLHGNDTDVNDQLGSSIAIGKDGDVVVVGAIAADLNGVYEKQSLYCSARSGAFTLSFRGWTSGSIAFDVSLSQLQDAIESDLNVMNQGLYGITDISIDSWSANDTNFCGGDNTAVITFYSPLDNVYNLTGWNATFPDIQPLTTHVDTLKMADGSTTGTLTITEHTKGTTKHHNGGSNLQQYGAAYVFRANCSTNMTTCTNRRWSQEAQLFPVPDLGTSGDMFGAAAAINDEGDVIVIGAPGGENSRGHVYIYQYEDHDGDGHFRWELHQRILIEATSNGDQAGWSVGIFGNTLVFGVPKLGGTGALYVFKRASKSSQFKQNQDLLPSQTVYPLQSGDLYGYSLAIIELYLAVGAPGRDDACTYRGRVANPSEDDTGAVFVFIRSSTALPFTFLQKLEPTNIRRHDRFGISLGMNHRTIVVGQQQEFKGALQPAKTIINITTTAAYEGTKLGATFKLAWEYKKISDGVMSSERQTTADIMFDSTALELEEILERDFDVGNVLVSRSAVDAYSGGYSWLVTFQDLTEIVDLFVPDITGLQGTQANVEVSSVNAQPPEIRGKSHVFTMATIESNQGSEGYFQEQGFFKPYSHQSCDRCGQSVAVDGLYAVMGCPNRDKYIPNQNAGSAFVYSLNILNSAFTASTYNVTEGGTVSLEVGRREGVYTDWNSSDVLLYIETLDRNADSTKQRYIQNMFGITTGDIPILRTAADESGTVGIAVGRSQYYGSIHNESQWVGGMYDYRGISDYVPVLSARAFLSEDSNVNVDLISTADTIFEAPDENISVILHAPGYWPSVYSDLFSMVTIDDNADGLYDSEMQYDKIYDDEPVSGANLGNDVSVCEGCKYMVSGSPESTYTTISNGITTTVEQSGSVIIYRLSDTTKKYEQEAVFFAPNPTSDMRYGDGVVVGAGFEDDSAIMVVGEPNALQCHIYTHANTSDSSITFAYGTALTADLVTLRQHRFGAQGTIGLDKNLLVIGAPGLEAIFVYYREYTNITGAWNWTEPALVRSSDFDYDVLWTRVKFHRQEFGTAVAVSGRTIAVGAPYADYDKLGTDLVEEDVDTEGPDIKGYGRGKVYTFYSMPAEEIIKYKASSSLTAGTWKLRYENYGRVEVTTELLYSAAAVAVETALEALTNVNDVSVTKSTTILDDSSYVYAFTVTFLSEFGSGQPAGKLTPMWNGGLAVGENGVNYACSVCTTFNPQSSDPSGQMYHDASTAMTAVLEQQIITTSDQRNGNRFGAVVALDGDQLVASATYSAGATTTSWDFETGQLTGWGATGTAFDHQPTFGDNSYLRAVYTPSDTTTGLRADKEGSRLQGRYYIGTYERHPGSTTDYTVPNSAYTQGDTQGDSPIGSLTSEVFVVRGDTITFLIGGGCDIYSIYVELLIDGYSVAKHTGKCVEKMDRVKFDTSLYQDRAAQIRIVDDAAGTWGHINCDDFQFSWDVRGGQTLLGNQAYNIGGLTETPRAGVVHTFHLTQYDTSISFDLCEGNKFNCVWTEEAKLIASDKRNHTMFGSSLSVNDEAGIIVVGSPFSEYTGFFKEAPTLYPYLNETSGAADVTVVSFPVDSQFMASFLSKDTMTAESSGAYGVWYMQRHQGAEDFSYAYEEAGAAYVFTKEHAVASATGIDVPQRWSLTEKVKLQAPNAVARDYFGSSVAISGSTVAVGAIGDDGGQPDAGAVHMYNAAFSAAYFSSLQYSALEGTDTDVTIYVSRDPDVYSGEIVLEYATSDLTATGVDATKFAACQALAATLRGPANCGDYEQTTGNLVIPEGSNQAGFKVKIMNDQCRERFLKFVQVTLSVPGSSVLQGESMVAKIRIDDDDFESSTCDWSK